MVRMCQLCGFLYQPLAVDAAHHRARPSMLVFQNRVYKVWGSDMLAHVLWRIMLMCQGK